MDQNPTIIFGLDGADFNMIDPWIHDGRLPALQGLIERGGRAQLESCVPATTPPAWTSLTTGMNPGKHGIFGFYKRHKNNYDIEPVSDSDVYARRLWDYTSIKGLTSLVVNVPVTHPGREFNGALVPGYLAKDQPETYPPNLLNEVGMSDYRVYAESESKNVSDSQLLDEWLELTKSRRDLALRLIDRYDWDLLFLEFQKTDGAVHKFNDSSLVRRIYECVDSCIGDIRETVNRDPNIFVVSDHGIGQSKAWAVALNSWFAEEGIVETTTTNKSTNSSWIDQRIADSASSQRNESLLGKVAGALGSIGFTKQRIERFLASVGLYELAVELAPENLGDSFEREVVDHAKSTAFYQGMGFSGVDVGIVLNNTNFYSDGIVSGEEYESVRTSVMKRIRTLDGPDGAPFASVQRREDIYTGQRVEYAPDIILEQAPSYVIGSEHIRGATFIPTDEGRIDHTRRGLIAAAGPDIDPMWKPTETPSIYDVTPTLLHLLDIQLNERFDGSVLSGLLTVGRSPQVQTYDPYEPPITDYSNDEKALEERLQAMGYLE